MAITYKHHLWNQTDGYKNMEDGVTSRIRVKKLEGGDEIKNLDIEIPLTELSSLTKSGLQTIIDALIAADVAEDTAEAAKAAIVIPPINSTINTKVKKIKTLKK